MIRNHRTESSLHSHRLLEIFLTLSLILIGTPLFVVAVVLTFFFSGSPIFFSQYRAGRHLDPIRITKIRTMKHGAERLHESLVSEHLAQGGDLFLEARHDFRITRVGKLIRRSSLDEFPQLFSVLRGTMALVGPRPCLYSELKHMGDRDFARFEVAPGVTGWWQVNRDSKHGARRAWEADRQYVDSQSLSLDLKILFRTPLAVLRGRGLE